MAYRIEFSRQAERQFRELPRKEQERLRGKIDRLCEVPYPKEAKKLAGEEGLYRIRSGDYRMIYSVEDDVLIVLVLKIGHRKEIYR